MTPVNSPGLHMASLGHPIVADSRYNPYKVRCGDVLTGHGRLAERVEAKEDAKLLDP